MSSLRRENVFKENQHPNMMMKRETKSDMLKRLPTSESSSKNSVRAPAVAPVTSDRPEPHRHKNTFAKPRFNLDLTFTPTSRPSLYPSPHPNLTPPSSPDLYPFPTLARVFTLSQASPLCCTRGCYLDLAGPPSNIF